MVQGNRKAAQACLAVRLVLSFEPLLLGRARNTLHQRGVLAEVGQASTVVNFENRCQPSGEVLLRDRQSIKTGK